MKRMHVGIALFLYVLVCCLFALPVNGFYFTKPELMLVEGSFDTITQENVSVTFDPVNNVLIAFEDAREGPRHIYSTIYTSNDELVGSYRAYQGSPVTHPHQFPGILHSEYYPDLSYCLAYDTYGTMLEHVMGTIDTATLPATPGVNDATAFSTLASGLDGYDSVSGHSFLFYIHAAGGNLYANTFNEASGTWIGETEINGGGSYLRNPSIAMDESGYIYIAYEEDTGGSGHYVYARRSVAIHDTTAWNATKEAFWHGSNGGFYPQIAVFGDEPGGDLRVAVAARFPDPANTGVVAVIDANEDWTQTTIPSTWDSGNHYASSILVSTTTVLAPDMAYDSVGNLFLCWSDDRDMLNQKAYGNVAYYSEFSFDSIQEVRLSDMAEDLYQAPRLAVGANSDDIAVVYSRYNGANISPYMLVSRATFFDSCDQDPATTGFWDSYAGVTVDSGIYFSSPASYQMASAKVKGTLLHEYSTPVEGRVSLQFYDDTANINENFYVGIQNTNEKGVIRMLGVRNDTTQSNYSYSLDGGITWVDTGLVRGTGWHAIEFVVNSSGLTMTMDPGSAGFSQTDPSMTAFTRLEMDGGTVSEPYHVDDIRFETSQISAEPEPIPALSPLFMLILLSALTLILLKR